MSTDTRHMISRGALAAAALSAGMIEALRRLGRLDPGVAMGVTFTTLFASGVLLLEGDAQPRAGQPTVYRGEVGA